MRSNKLNTRKVRVPNDRQPTMPWHTYISRVCFVIIIQMVFVSINPYTQHPTLQLTNRISMYTSKATLLELMQHCVEPTPQ